MSPERRRKAVVVVQEPYRASGRLICRVVGQHPAPGRQGHRPRGGKAQESPTGDRL